MTDTFSRTVRDGIRGMQVVEHRGHGGKQRVVAGMQGAGTGHHRREAGAFRSRNAADVEVVYQGAESRQTQVSLQSEALDQHFESHLGIDVGELRAVEIETDRAPRAVGEALEPQELRL